MSRLRYFFRNCRLVFERVIARRAAPPRSGRSTTPRAERLEPRCLMASANMNFVAKAYRDLLLRVADPGGLAYWAGRLDHGEQTSIIAQALTHSDEYYQTNVIKPAYKELLDRAVDG